MSDSSTQRQSGDKRKQILAAAIRVFARSGYQGCRVSDIAREAGVAYGLVYHYFKNKEEILDSVFEERWSSFLAALELIAEGSQQIEEKLLAIAALVLDAYREHGDWVRVLVFEIQRSPRFSNPGQIKAMRRLFAIVRRMLCEARRDGELRGDLDPAAASLLFIGGLDIAMTTRVLQLVDADGEGPREEEPNPAVARSVVDVFLNGIRVEASGP